MSIYTIQNHLNKVPTQPSSSPSTMILKQLHNLPHKTQRFSDSPSKPPLRVVAVQATMPSASIVGAKPKNLYDVLQVERDASLMEVKKAYRHLAKLYHPDSSSDQADSKDFVAIHEAYATLSDPTARVLYDLTIHVGDPTWYSRNRYRHGWRWETDQCW